MRIIDDRYVIVANEEPRVGGMSEVWRAIDMKEGQKPVAIKLFRENLESDRYLREAYSRESKALLMLDHPNIVKILDGGIDRESGRRYFVLEWLDTSLIEYLEKHPLGGWDSFYEEIGNPILNALAYAYGKGIFHRDLKPQNVLFCPEGIIKIADFGICKMKSFVSLGLTVGGFKSEPYSPPEPDDGRYTETRDVYSFAVLALTCLCNGPIVTYEDVYHCFEELDVPPEIEDILESALSRNPKFRPNNILNLKSKIDVIQNNRTQDFHPIEKRRCYVKISLKVEKKLRRLLDNVGIDHEKFVIDDLNEICGFQHYISDNNNLNQAIKDQGDIRLSLYGAQYLYAAVIDDKTHGYLVLTDVFPFQPSYLDYKRDSSWIPEITFSLQIGSHVTEKAAETITWIIDGLLSHECKQRELETLARSERLFKMWAVILQAKSDLEKGREKPIPYYEVVKEGSRIKLFTELPLDDELIGQPRLIEISENHVIAGEVESIGDNYIILWLEPGTPSEVPNRGKLLFDTRAGKTAIRRQRQALDAIQFGRASRPDLKDLLIDPQKAKPPSELGKVDFIQELDESKQEAVIKALATDSFLVVHGPPGTGKTKFITELVVQTIRHTPHARILVTSQTHVALDNALENIRRLNPELKLVRIGHRHDERISQDVADLLLENRVDNWLDTVKARSEKFLEDYAKMLKVDRNDLSLGIAAERLRAALDDIELLQEKKEEAETDLNQFLEQQRKREAEGTNETFHELKQLIRDTSEIILQLDINIDRARQRLDIAKKTMSAIPNIGKELSMAASVELKDWEDAFLKKDETASKMHRLVMLTEEWFLRFGRTSDFFAAFISDCEVVTGTCLGFAGIRGIQNLNFDLCIVDEASKATVTELLVPMSQSKKWILVGDRNQLPPFVDDALENRSLLETYSLSPEDLSATLLEILAENLPSACVTRLVHQHRMIRPIGDLISHCFYDDELKSSNMGAKEELQPAIPRPVTWLSTSSLPSHREQRDRHSYKNLSEVNVVRSVLKRLDFIAKAKGRHYSIAVLTCYSSQKVELRRAIDTEHQSLSNIEIECNTVDAFQGREADVTIYSVTRCNEQGDIGFLRERKRINVALSRARIGLVIIGDAAFIRSAKGYNPWIKVLDYIESHPTDCIIEEEHQ